MGFSNLPTAYELIHYNVRQVRKQLEKNGIGPDDMYPDYAGLCYQATGMFIEAMQKSCERRGIELKFKSIHGEQAHTPRIPSTKWPAQHQWCWVELFGKRYYVDCTCGQFKTMYDDIPDYYISVKKPKWFLNDRRNIALNGITKWFNQKIIVSRHIVQSDWGPMEVHDGIIELFQYEVWGRISDFIRKIVGRDKK